MRIRVGADFDDVRTGTEIDAIRAVRCEGDSRPIIAVAARNLVIACIADEQIVAIAAFQDIVT